MTQVFMFKIFFFAQAYFSCNGEAQSKSGDHVEKNLVDSQGRVVRILSLVIYREQVDYLFRINYLYEFFWFFFNSKDGCSLNSFTLTTNKYPVKLNK